MPGPNQIERLRDDVRVAADELLRAPAAPGTEAGLRLNVRVGIQYLEAWLRGSGCVPLYHLMEDAATAEISRAQVWQWIRHAARLDDGRRVTPELLRGVVREEMKRIAREVGSKALSRRTIHRGARPLRAPVHGQTDAGVPDAAGVRTARRRPPIRIDRGTRSWLIRALRRPVDVRSGPPRAGKRRARDPRRADAGMASSAPIRPSRSRRYEEPCASSTRSRGWAPSGSGSCSAPANTSPPSARSPGTRPCSR